MYGDQAMPYPDKYNEEFDFFLAIKLILTPTFTVIRCFLTDFLNLALTFLLSSFAFTVPLVLKRIVEEKQQVGIIL